MADRAHIPSLTPMEDAMRAMLARPEFTGQASRPGYAGLKGRFNVAISSAVMIAQAQAVDSGADRGLVAKAVAQSFGGNMAGLVVGLDLNPEETIGLFDHLWAEFRAMFAALREGEPDYSMFVRTDGAAPEGSA